MDEPKTEPDGMKSMNEKEYIELVRYMVKDLNKVLIRAAHNHNISVELLKDDRFIEYGDPDFLNIYHADIKKIL